MSAVDRPSAATFAVTSLPSPAIRVAGALRGLMRALANRRHLVRLHNLSDRGLTDIGLMRLDLDFAGRAPLNIDPTLRLAAAARERRTAPRAGQS